MAASIRKFMITGGRFVNEEEKIIMNSFKCRVFREYPDSNIIIAFLEWAKQYPHELKRCDGSMTLYYKCQQIVAYDGALFRYGDNWYLQPSEVKKYMKRLIKEIKGGYQWKYKNTNN